MREKLATITVAGVLVLGGAAVAGPALAETTQTTQKTAEAVTSRVERITEALTGLVSDGTLTQEQANDVASTLAEELPGPGGPGGGPGDHHGGGLGMGLDAAADALSMTTEELREALAQEGATLSSVAEDQGVSTDDLVAALVEAAGARLDEEVAEGELTQEEADERAGDLESRISELVTSELGAHGPGGHGPGGPGAGGPGSSDEGSATTPEDGTPATPSSWTYAA